MFKLLQQFLLEMFKKVLVSAASQTYSSSCYPDTLSASIHAVHERTPVVVLQPIMEVAGLPWPPIRLFREEELLV